MKHNIKEPSLLSWCVLCCSLLRATLRIICTSFRTRRYGTVNGWHFFLGGGGLLCFGFFFSGKNFVLFTCSTHLCLDWDVNSATFLILFSAMGRRGGDQCTGCHVQVRVIFIKENMNLLFRTCCYDIFAMIFNNPLVFICHSAVVIVCCWFFSIRKYFAQSFIDEQ